MRSSGTSHLDVCGHGRHHLYMRAWTPAGVALGGIQSILREAEVAEVGDDLGLPTLVLAASQPAVDRTPIHGGWKGRSGTHGPKGLSVHHHAIIDEMLTNPGESNSVLAAKFNLTPSYLSCIIHSDAFQLELSKRRHEVKVGIVTKVSALADLVTEKLLHKLPNIEDPELLLDIQKTNLKALGYGAPQRGAGLGGPTVNVGVTLVSQETVHAARLTMDARRQALPPPAFAPAEPESLDQPLGAVLDGTAPDGPPASPPADPPS